MKYFARFCIIRGKDNCKGIAFSHAFLQHTI